MAWVAGTDRALAEAHIVAVAVVVDRPKADTAASPTVAVVVVVVVVALVAAAAEAVLPEAAATGLVLSRPFARARRSQWRC